jgi:hypothetical protein
MRNVWIQTAASAVAAVVLSAGAMATEPTNVAADQQPGSVLVFPKFTQGSLVVNEGTPAQYTAARSVFEVNAICPVGGLNPECGPDTTIFVHFRWVCPPRNDANGNPIGNICSETDFIESITEGAGHADTITFNPSGIVNPPGTDVNGNTSVAIVNCPNGYLIAYVVDSTDRPIKFDGLMGNAHLRGAGGTDFGLQSYRAIAIQADPNAALGAVLDTATGLHFDGLPGHYQMVTGQLQGPVGFDRQTNPPFTANALVLMTLDVNLGLANNPTFLPMQFFTHEGPEARLSTETSFICWEQVTFTTNPLDMLTPNLTAELFGSDFFTGPSQSYGLLVTGQAIDAVTLTPRTLLGFVIEREFPSLGTSAVRSVIDSLGNNSRGVPTTFKFQQ